MSLAPLIYIIAAMVYGVIAAKLGHVNDAIFWTGLLYGAAVYFIGSAR